MIVFLSSTITKKDILKSSRSQLVLIMFQVVNKATHTRGGKEKGETPGCNMEKGTWLFNIDDGMRLIK